MLLATESKHLRLLEGNLIYTLRFLKGDALKNY